MQKSAHSAISFYTKQNPKRKFEANLPNSNKENDQNGQNVPVIDLSKKIRKRSPRKYAQPPKKEMFNGFTVYRDEEIGIDTQFSGMTQPQRIDNDVDTDEEQIEEGIGRLIGFLTAATNMRAQEEGEMID